MDSPAGCEERNEDSAHELRVVRGMIDSLNTPYDEERSQLMFQALMVRHAVQEQQRARWLRRLVTTFAGLFGLQAFRLLSG